MLTLHHYDGDENEVILFAVVTTASADLQLQTQIPTFRQESLSERWESFFFLYLLVDLHQMRTILALSVPSFCVHTNHRNVNHFTDFDSYMHICSKFVLKVTRPVIPHLHHLVSQITHGEMSEEFLGIFLEHFDQVDYLLFPKLLHLSIKHIITVLWTTASDAKSQHAFDNLLQSLLTVL